MSPPPGTLARRIVFDDLLVDRAEDRLAVVAEHLDADAVAELHEGCRGLAGVDGLAYATLGDARAAGGGIAVGDRPRTDDGAGLEVACLCRMGDELAEIEGEIGRRVGMAEFLPVERRN